MTEENHYMLGSKEVQTEQVDLTKGIMNERVVRGRKKYNLKEKRKAIEKRKVRNK